MLAFGRQPSSPIDMLIATSSTATSFGLSGGQYLQTLVKKKEELIDITRRNPEHSRLGAKERYDKGK